MVYLLKISRVIGFKLMVCFLPYIQHLLAVKIHDGSKIFPHQLLSLHPYVASIQKVENTLICSHFLLKGDMMNHSRRNMAQKSTQSTLACEIWP